MSRWRWALIAAVVGLAWPPPAAHAQGHGPAFGLSTPTLGRGAWSLDIGTMSRLASSSSSTMIRPMGSFGITENLQLSLSLPVPLHLSGELPQARAMTRMPMSPDVELVMGWRFHRQDVRVGARFETTGYAGLTYPTVAEQRGVRTAPGVWAGVVTGYASRSLYVWVGALHRRYLPAAGPDRDLAGSSTMYSAVVGYRPPAFRHDYPRADWRLFVEMVGESADRDRIAGVEQGATGGHQIFLGPTVLGIFGSWAISGGPLFPVYRSVNGGQPTERVRIVVNTSFWFF